MERNLSYLSLVAVWVGSREDEDGVSRIVLSQKTRASYGPYLTLLPMIPPFYMKCGYRKSNVHPCCGMQQGRHPWRFWSGSGLTLYIYFCNDAMLPSIQISMAASLHTIKQCHSYGMSDTWMISGQIGRKVVCPIKCIYSWFDCLDYHWIDERFSCNFIICMGTLTWCVIQTCRASSSKI